MQCFAEFICAVNWIGKCCHDGPTPRGVTWDHHIPWDHNVYWS